MLKERQQQVVVVSLVWGSPSSEASGGRSQAEQGAAFEDHGADGEFQGGANVRAPQQVLSQQCRMNTAPGTVPRFVKGSPRDFVTRTQVDLRSRQYDEIRPNRFPLFICVAEKTVSPLVRSLWVQAHPQCCSNLFGWQHLQ
jgi:hypothetical protein